MSYYQLSQKSTWVNNNHRDNIEYIKSKGFSTDPSTYGDVSFDLPKIEYHAQTSHPEARVLFSNGLIAQGRLYFREYTVYVADCSEGFESRLENANASGQYTEQVVAEKMVQKGSGNKAHFIGITLPLQTRFKDNVVAVQITRSGWEIAGYAQASDTTSIFYRTDDGWFFEGNGPYTPDEFINETPVGKTLQYNGCSSSSDVVTAYWGKDKHNSYSIQFDRMIKLFKTTPSAIVTVKFSPSSDIFFQIRSNSFLVARGKFTFDGGVLLHCDYLPTPLKLTENGGDPLPGISEITLSVHHEFWANDPIILETATGKTWARFAPAGVQSSRLWDEYAWVTHDSEILRHGEIDYSKFEKHPNVIAEKEATQDYEWDRN